jgi:hypothetical protein
MDRVTLVDPEGRPQDYGLLAVVELDDALYAVLTPWDALGGPEDEPLPLRVLPCAEVEGRPEFGAEVEPALAQQVIEIAESYLLEDDGDEA